MSVAGSEQHRFTLAIEVNLLEQARNGCTNLPPEVEAQIKAKLDEAFRAVRSAGQVLLEHAQSSGTGPTKYASERYESYVGQQSVPRG